MTYQQVIIVGNVGRDAEIKYTPQGVAVCDFSVAVNKVTGKGESRKEKTTWFKVTVWRERAEVAGQYVRKGMKIMCIGEIDVHAYVDKSGDPRGSLDLTANDFKFLDAGPGSGGTSGTEEPPEEDAGPGDIPF